MHTPAFTPVPESPAFQGEDERKSIWGFRYGVSDSTSKKPRLSRGILTSLPKSLTIQKSNRQGGFTLIEMLVVMGIVAIVAIVGFFNFGKAKINQGTKASAEQLSDTLKRAHIFSREAKEGVDWKVENDSLTSYSLKKHDSLDPANWITDTTKDLEKGTEFTDDFSVLFGIGTGEVTTAQQIILKNTNNIQISVNVTITGVVEVQPL